MARMKSAVPLARAASMHVVLAAYTVVALFPVFVIVVNAFKNRRGIFLTPLA